MTILFFGNYIRDYPRIQVLQKAMRENNIQFIECHTRKTGWAKYFELFKQHRQFRHKYDLLLVGMGGYTLVWLAKLLTSKKVIFDAFVSQYLTNVEDRKKVKPHSLKAKYYAFLDKYSCQMADKVLLDTQAQIDYFVRRYKLPREKFVRVFISSNDEVFKPTDNLKLSTNRFIVHWHGHIVPFHGIETIIKVAEILKGYQDIEFRLVTRFNSKYKKLKSLTDSQGLVNVKFYPETNYEGLARAINEADICLGIFGDNAKARVVIPNKIYEAIACGKPVITARFKVLEELFTDGENILLCEPSDPENLADKILSLKVHSRQRVLIGQNGRKLYWDLLRPYKLLADFINQIPL